MKVYVVGSLNMDLVIQSPYMPEGGETLTGGNFMTNPGGKGANQAVALAKLGAEAYMVGGVGNTFGDELLSTLKGYGVRTEFVKIYDGVSSGIAVIIVVDGDNRIILDRGANGALDKAQVDRALETAERGDYLVCQLEVGLDVVEYAMQRAKEKGLVTVLNPAPATELTDKIFASCDYFMPNQTEAKIYTGIYPDSEETAKQCAIELYKKGVKNIVITMGEHGSVAICDGKLYRAKAVYVENAIDTTAAGDTYVGAFVVALTEGKDYMEAMSFASKASAITVTRRGAQCSIPYRKEL